jgi:carboxymethylenebutenolidase
MNGSTIDVATPDGVADSYLVRPDAGNHPAVLFMIDAIGLRPRIEEMADRIAGQGYTVLAPNVFYRAGRAPMFEMPDLTNPDNRAGFFEKIRPLMQALTKQRMESDGGAYLDKLADVAPGPVAVTGYCMGGRFGWTIAASHPDRVAALGGFHTGGLVNDTPESPHLLADKVNAEVYFGHADQDQNMTPEQISRLDSALDSAGVTHTTEVYAGAMHGYTMSDSAVWNPEACERHFDALFGLLGRTFGS